MYESWIRVCMYVCMYVFSTNGQVFKCMYLCIPYMYVCMYVCMYVWAISLCMRLLCAGSISVGGIDISDCLVRVSAVVHNICDKYHFIVVVLD